MIAARRSGDDLMPKVFISHSTQDREFVEREIIAALHQGGIETWYSKMDIHAADRWERSRKWVRTEYREAENGSGIP